MDESPKKVFTIAQKYYKSGQYEKASQMFKKILNKEAKYYSFVRDKFILSCRKNREKLKKINVLSTKYPTTPHLPFSEYTTEDDKKEIDTDKFKNKKIVITEKLDGENCCIYDNKVFARTHSHPTSNKSFDPIKEICYGYVAQFLEINKIPKSYMLFGENITNIRNIEYTRAYSYFYLFGVFDRDYNTWLSWDEVESIADICNLPLVPVLYKGDFSEEVLKEKIDNLKSKMSCLGDIHPEGFVVRNLDSYTNFDKNVSKFVRKDFKPIIKREIDKIKIQKTKIPKLIILTGFPGSGKSTFTNALVKSDPDLVVVSQDKLGCLSKCIELFNLKYKKHKIVVDRCNLTEKERKLWIDYGFNNNNYKIVFFDTPLNVCRLRTRIRQNHETVKTDSDYIYKNIEKKLDINVKDKNVVVIKSKKDANDILIRWNCETISEDLDVIKYPEVRHLCDIRELYPEHNISSIKRNESMVKERDKFLQKNLIIEELLDGTLIGITYDIFEDKFLIQHAEQYGNSDKQNELEKFQIWIDDNKKNLIKILGSGELALFGEICIGCAKDFFCSDILDRKNNKFFSRNRFYQEIEKTTLKKVPLITYTTLNKIKNIKKFLEFKSEYFKSNVKGIVLRIDDEEYLTDKCKIVGIEFGKDK